MRTHAQLLQPFEIERNVNSRTHSRDRQSANGLYPRAVLYQKKTFSGQCVYTGGHIFKCLIWAKASGDAKIYGLIHYRPEDLVDCRYRLAYPNPLQQHGNGGSNAKASG